MSSFGKKKILVIQDSVEIVRQPHADLRDFILEVLDSMETLTSGYSIEFISGDAAVEEVSNLKASSYDLILFASNAIIRRETSLYQELEKESDLIESFLRNRRSVIFLHQGFAGNDSEIPFLRFSGGSHWAVAQVGTDGASADTGLNLEIVQSHQIVQYPNEISADDISKHFSKTNFPITYSWISHTEDPAIGYTSIVRLGQRAKAGDVLATCETTGRLVLCPSPLDWAKYRELFVNVLTYALFLEPDIVVVDKTVHTADGDCNTARRDYVSMVESYLGKEHNLVRLKPDELGSLKAKDYRVQSASLFLCTDDQSYTSAVSNPAISEAINRGASLLQLKTAEIGDEGRSRQAESLGIIVGSQTHRLKSIVRSCLNQLVHYEWPRNGLIHDLRDIEFALAHAGIREDEAAQDDKKNWDQQVLKRLGEWFDSCSISDDPCTAVTALWLGYRVSGAEGKAFIKRWEEEFQAIRGDKRLEDNVHVLDALLNIAAGTDVHSNSSRSGLGYNGSPLITGSGSGAFAPENSGVSLTTRKTSLGSVLRRFDAIQMLGLITGRKGAKSEGPNVEDAQNAMKYLEEWDQFLDRSGTNVAAVASISRLLLASMIPQQGMPDSCDNPLKSPGQPPSRSFRVGSSRSDESTNDVAQAYTQGNSSTASDSGGQSLSGETEDLATQRHKTLQTFVQYFLNIADIDSPQVNSGNATELKVQRLSRTSIARQSEQSENYLGPVVAANTEPNSQDSEELKIFEVQKLLKRLIACAALATINEAYPFGGAYFISRHASLNQSVSSADSAKAMIADLRRTITERNQECARLRDELSNSRQEFYRRSRVHIWIGTSVVWLFIGLLVLLSLVLSGRAVLAWNNEGVFDAVTATAVTVVPVAIAVITWLVRRKYHNPNRWNAAPTSTKENK